MTTQTATRRAIASLLRLLAAGSLASCVGTTVTGDNPLPSSGSGAGAGQGVIVHEWGTYTSVHATDGHALGGVHHVDEALPGWVYRRDFTPQSYNFEQLPEEPLQQLETPVLYFHSAGVQRVHVDVSFPEGIVGEWFPSAAGFAPARGAMTKVGGGSMSWDVTLDPGIQASTFPPVQPDEIWAPSRNVAATPVSVVNDASVEEHERFIFYRGLARFHPPFTTKVAADETITLSNPSPDAISAVFVLRTTATSGRFVALGPLAAGAQITAPAPQAVESLDAFVAHAREGLREALVATGLYPDEAQAMVDTWTRSWFKNHGLRVLYVAPRAWADGFLPMKVSPAPAELERTLVGRVELLTHAEEDQLVSDLTAASEKGTAFPLDSLGRFAEPRLARAIEQLADPSARGLAQSLHDQVHAQP